MSECKICGGDHETWEHYWNEPLDFTRPELLREAYHSALVEIGKQQERIVELEADLEKYQRLTAEYEQQITRLVLREEASVPWEEHETKVNAAFAHGHDWGHNNPAPVDYAWRNSEVKAVLDAQRMLRENKVVRDE